MRYVVGFLFDKETRSQVVLILKRRPPWQAGLFNGVGGKVEPGESLHQAMRREFMEEAGVDIDDWEPYARLFDLKRDSFEVIFFRAFAPWPAVKSARTMTSETVQVVSATTLPTNRLPNLAWLIPLALETDDVLVNSLMSPTSWERRLST